MKSEKGVRVNIYKDPINGYVMDTQTDFDTCRVALNLVDIIHLRNELNTVIEKAKQNDKSLSK